MWIHVLLWYLPVLIGALIVILVETRNPYKAFSWLLVVALLPVVGLLLYMMFGRDMRLGHYYHHDLYRRITHAPKALVVPAHYQQLRQDPQVAPIAKLLESNNESLVLAAQDISIFTRGAEKYAQLFSDLQQAHHFIHMEYYILMEDPLGKDLRDLLVQKALQGVQVRLLYDALGSSALGNSFRKPLKDAGGEVAAFGAWRFPYLGAAVNNRNHRKIVVIDGKIGYLGGMNVAMRYIKGNKLGDWRDTHFRITGSAVAGLQRAFLRDWHYSTQEGICSSSLFPIVESPSTQTPILMQFATNGPIGKSYTLEQSLVQAIMRANQSIYIETPYFLPTEQVANALITAALRGVEIWLLIPKKGDSAMASWAAQSYLEEFLEAGGRVFWYTEGFLHSKLMVIDHKIASIGSANIDYRSLELNYELNAFVYNTPVATRIEQVIKQDIAIGTELTSEEWKQRSRWQRFRESFFRLWAPML